MYRLVLIALVIILSCNEQRANDTSFNATKDTVEGIDEIDTAVKDIAGCYVSILKHDTALLKINNENGMITGDLAYRRFQKDDNVGTIKGRVEDGLVIAAYTFQSEGITSVREVVFKIEGPNLIEGYGDIDMVGDTAAFKNISQLKYEYAEPFVKGECK